MSPFDETGFEVQVASSMDRDDVFIELAFNRATVAELVSDPSTGRTALTLFGPPGGGAWVFDAAEFRAALERAERRARVAWALEPPSNPPDG